MAVTYTAGGAYHQAPNSPDFALPNGDWSIVYFVKPTGTISGSPYSTGPWGTLDNYFQYVSSYWAGFNQDAMASDVIAPEISADEWSIVIHSRSGNTVTGRKIEFGDSVVSTHTSETLSIAVTPSTPFTVGARDLGFEPIQGALSDLFILPGTAISDADLIDIATGSSLYGMTWWPNVVFHLICFDSPGSQLDTTGRHTVTLTGSVSVVSDPPQLVRGIVVGVPEMVDPIPGSVIPGSSVTFTWDNNNSEPDAYWMYVGSSEGGVQFHNSGRIDAPALSEAVSGLPLDGATKYVSLFHMFEPAGPWIEEKLTYGMLDASPEAAFNLDGGGEAGFVQGLPNIIREAPTYTLDNYHVIRESDTPLELPNTDWSLLVVLTRPVDMASTSFFVSSGQGTDDDLMIFFASGQLRAYVGTVLLNPVTVSESAGTWIAVCVSRSGTNANIRYIALGSPSIGDTATPKTLSGAVSLDDPVYLGKPYRVTGDPFSGSMSDFVLINGISLSDQELIDIANNSDWSESTWWPSRQLHVIGDIAAPYGKRDELDLYTVTYQGSSPASIPQSQYLARPTLSAKRAIPPIVSPVPGEQLLIDTNLTVTWTNPGLITGTNPWEVRVGSTPGGIEYGNTTNIPAATLTAAYTGLPLQGQPIHIELLDTVNNDTNSHRITVYAYSTPAPTDLTTSGLGVAAFAGATPTPRNFIADGVGGQTFNVRPILSRDMIADGAGTTQLDGFSVGFISSMAGGKIAESNVVTSVKSLSDANCEGAGQFDIDGNSFFATDAVFIGSGFASIRPVHFDTFNLSQHHNSFIIARNLFDETSAKSASSVPWDHPLGNLGNDQKTYTWRSNIGVTDPWIECQWAEARSINSIAFAFTNLSRTASVQFKGYILAETPDESPDFDSGPLAMNHIYEPPGDFYSNTSDSFPFGGGNHMGFLFKNHASVRRLRIYFDDTLNINSSIEIARLIIGDAFTPEHGAAYGANIDYVAATLTDRTAAGDYIALRGPMSKRMDFTLDSLTGVEQLEFQDIIHNRGRAQPVFVNIYDQASADSERQAFMIYGHFIDIPEIVLTQHENYRSNITIKEI